MASHGFECCHALAGRLRIKMAAIKRSPANAREIEKRLKEFPGITSVKSNPMTGSVLIHYDEDRIRQPGILEAVQALGYQVPRHAKVKRHDHKPLSNSRDKVVHELGRIVAKSLVELAIQKAIFALL